MMRQAIFLLMTTIMSSAWADEALLRQLQQKNQALSHLDGSFAQRKQMSVLPAPLLSEGEFSYRPDTGIVWRTLEPLTTEIIINQQGVYQSDQRFLGPGENAQVSRAIARLFMGLFTGDIEILTGYFDILASGDIDAWQLVLTPANPVLDEYIQSVRLTGGKHTETVDILEPNGDRTLIELSIPESEPQ